MRFRDGGEFFIWKTNSHWKGEKEFEKVTFDLEKPSSFKVVVRSSLPFHGLVSESPVNEAFLKVCGFNLPRHVTIVPLFNFHQESKLIGLLVSFGDESAKNLGSLKIAEECGTKLSELISDLLEEAA